MKFRYLLSALTVLGVSASSYAETVVIVNANAKIDSASAQEIADIFLGKQSAINGVQLKAIDVDKGSPSRAVFLDKIVNKNEDVLKKYWSRLIFTGKGVPPQGVGPDAAVAAAVASNPNFIGVVDKSSVGNGTKIILNLQ